VQLTLISTVTIGVPGFFLALGPNTRRYLPGFLGRVLRFAVPTGLVTGTVAYAAYAASRWLDPGAGVAGARTTATLVVLVVALWTVGVLARPLAAWKVGLIAAMAAVAALCFAVPVLRGDLLLLRLTPYTFVLAATLGAAGALLVEAVHRLQRVSGRGAGPRRRSSGRRTGRSAWPEAGPR
jgi:cation-transporting ATPase E